MKRWFIPCLLVVAGLLITETAFAHERVVSGQYAFVLGWLEEPPVVGLKNAVTIEVSLDADGAPLTGAEGSLTAQLEFGGQTRELILAPVEDTPGLYLSSFIPTRRGTYTVRLGGIIDGEPIEATAEIEEVGSAASLEFPEAQPAASDLQQSIEGLRGEIGTARAFGVAGAALGAIGLVLAAVSLGRKK
ncbi:MAG TPA: hypothetical protein VJG32_19450 [Anaerolineae bacterium]|nr:hypothetical protein [Anaerolineae bacterium]